MFQFQKVYENVFLSFLGHFFFCVKEALKSGIYRDLGGQNPKMQPREKSTEKNVLSKKSIINKAFSQQGKKR